MSRIISVTLLSALAIGCGQAATGLSDPAAIESGKAGATGLSGPAAIESGEAGATGQLISLNLPGMT